MSRPSGWEVMLGREGSWQLFWTSVEWIMSEDLWSLWLVQNIILHNQWFLLDVEISLLRQNTPLTAGYGLCMHVKIRKKMAERIEITIAGKENLSNCGNFIRATKEPLIVNRHPGGRGWGWMIIILGGDYMVLGGNRGEISHRQQGIKGRGGGNGELTVNQLPMRKGGS